MKVYAPEPSYRSYSSLQKLLLVRNELLQLTFGHFALFFGRMCLVVAVAAATIMVASLLS